MKTTIKRLVRQVLCVGKGVVKSVGKILLAKKPIKERIGASCATVKLPNKIRGEVCALMMLLKPIQIIEPPHFAKCGGKWECGERIGCEIW